MGLDGVFAALAILLLAVAVAFPAYFWIVDRKRRGDTVKALHVALTVLAVVASLCVAWFLWPLARAHDLL